MVAKKKTAKKKKAGKKGAPKKATKKKTAKKKTAKDKKDKSTDNAGNEDPGTSEASKREKTTIDALKSLTGEKAQPLEVTDTLKGHKKRVRGPDKQPRKPRSDRGEKRDPVLDEKQAAQVTGEPAAQVQPQVTPAAKAYLITKAFAVTADNTIFRLLPPKMTQMERQSMIDVWSPVVEIYADSLFASPWFPAALVSVGVMTPRIGAKWQARKQRKKSPSTPHKVDSA